MATVEATAQRGDLGTTGRLPADEAEIDTLMRRFFVQSQVKPIKAFEPDVKGVDAQGSAPRRDFDMATELLDRASQAFDLLMDRCQGLEHDLDIANEQARVSVIPSFFGLGVPTWELHVLSVFEAVFWRLGSLYVTRAPRRR